MHIHKEEEKTEKKKRGGGQESETWQRKATREKMHGIIVPIRKREIIAVYL